jgi:hypothetical protein
MNDNVTVLPGLTPVYREREPNQELIAYLEGALQRARKGDTMAAVVCEQR